LNENYFVVVVEKTFFGVCWTRKTAEIPPAFFFQSGVGKVGRKPIFSINRFSSNNNNNSSKGEGDKIIFSLQGGIYLFE